jgi:hypothetical protein
MLDLEVFVVENQQNSKYDERLRKSAFVNDVNINWIGNGVDWKGNSTKIKLFITLLCRSKAKYALCLDSRDVLFYDKLETICKRFKIYLDRGYKVVYNAETNCFPRPEIAGMFPSQDKKYKYLNSGAIIGDRRSIVRIFRQAKKWHSKMPYIKNDQYFHQAYFLRYGNEKKITLDYNCNIFQVMWDQGMGGSANYDLIYSKNYIYNQHTQSFPCIFHYPGPSGTAETVYRIINKNFY